ncbi:MAG: hypothetical protein H7X77_08630 [Anaerolineae bacterium]|nr:hypothetical protein [Anaerolineae bacterium]
MATIQERLLDELAGDKAYGVLLMLQMDGVPETLQLVVATTELDEKAGGLRDKSRYLIRAIGVQEHRISVGMFGSLDFTNDHPLLDQYNTTPVGLFFRGTPDDTNALMVDILQAYATTFGPWRQIPQYLNVNKPLLSLLGSGGDLLGEMPKTLSEQLVKVLEQHELEHKIVEGESPDKLDEHNRSQMMKALIIDDSYIVALDFNVEVLGKV